MYELVSISNLLWPRDAFSLWTSAKREEFISQASFKISNRRSSSLLLHSGSSAMPCRTKLFSIACWTGNSKQWELGAWLSKHGRNCHVPSARKKPEWTLPRDAASVRSTGEAIWPPCIAVFCQKCCTGRQSQRGGASLMCRPWNHAVQICQGHQMSMIWHKIPKFFHQPVRVM